MSKIRFFLRLRSGRDMKRLLIWRSLVYAEIFVLKCEMEHFGDSINQQNKEVRTLFSYLK